MQRIAGLGLRTRTGGGLGIGLAHADGARLAVDLEEDPHIALGIGRGGALQADQQRLALVQFDGDFLVFTQAVEEG